MEAVESYERNAAVYSAELIVITHKVLDEIIVKGHKVIRQNNVGLPTARNNGLGHARGKVILFLDDDNRLLAPYFSVGLKLMLSDPSIDVVYGDRLDFGDWDRLVQIGPIAPEELWVMNRIDNCALIRRSYLNRCNGYDVKLTGIGFEDWELWLNGLSQDQGLSLRYLNLPCFEYRVRNHSMLHRVFDSKSLQNKLMGVLNSKYPGRVGHGGFH